MNSISSQVIQHSCERKYTKTCAECGKEFRSELPFQNFCSPKCTRNYYHKHGKEHIEPQGEETILRTFVCRQCRRNVYVVSKTDRRSVFFCQACEKKYWRDLTKCKSRGRSSNQGMSGGMSLGSLIKRERRDLN